MPRKEGLKRRADDMARAYKGRRVRISAKKEGTAHLLDGFYKVLVGMNSRSRAGLAKVSSGLRKMDPKRKKQTRSEIKQIQAEIKRMRADVSQILDEFHQYQAETNTAWKDLFATLRATRVGMPTEKLKEEISEKGEEEMYKIDFPPLNGDDY